MKKVATYAFAILFVTLALSSFTTIQKDSIPNTKTSSEFETLVNYLEAQGRFKHIVKNADIVNEIQAEVDRRWNELLVLCGE